MRLLIDEKELALLLEKKRDLIGNKVTIDTIIAGISFYFQFLQPVMMIYWGFVEQESL